MFSFTIRTDNDAFDDDRNAEISRLLDEAAQRVRRGDVSGMLRDANGNTVGSYGNPGAVSPVTESRDALLDALRALQAVAAMGDEYYGDAEPRNPAFTLVAAAIAKATGE